MGAEFLYIKNSKNDEISRLLESFGISVKEKDEIFTENALISNNSKADITAPEIDWYLKYSSAPLFVQASNIKSMYEARAIVYDFSKTEFESTDLGNKILIISKSDESLNRLSAKISGFADVYLSGGSDIIGISGELGNIKVRLQKGEIEECVEVSQIAVENPSESLLKLGGIVAFGGEIEDDSVVSKLQSRIGNFEYKKVLSYDSAICQYNERQTPLCKACATVCPSMGVSADDSVMKLSFSGVECSVCAEGGCVSVCPSGALEFQSFSKESFFEVSKLFKDKIPFVVPEYLIEDLDMKLRHDLLPFVISGAKFLEEWAFLTLLGESGSQVIFYSKKVAPGTLQAIEMLNDLYMRVFNTKAIYLCKDKESLAEAMRNAVCIDGSFIPLAQTNAPKKRQDVAIRIARLIGKNDYGKLDFYEFTKYGLVEVDKDRCTMCLGCATVCNVNALFADQEKGELLFSAPECTTCGYCEAVCPEKCITVARDGIHLNGGYFSHKTLVADEPFLCIECGVPIAPKKAIEKVTAMMTPLFANDMFKLKSIHCCPTCKARLSVEAFAEQKFGAGEGL